MVRCKYSGDLILIPSFVSFVTLLCASSKPLYGMTSEQNIAWDTMYAVYSDSHTKRTIDSILCYIHAYIVYYSKSKITIGSRIA